MLLQPPPTAERWQAIGRVAERLAGHYDERYRDAVTPERISVAGPPVHRCQMAVRLVLAAPGGRYLEIGAGTGAVALTVRPRFDELVLTELSAPRVAQLRRLFAGDEHVLVVRQDIEQDAAALPEAHFDTVLLTDVIEHLVEPIAVASSLRRALRPGGRLIVQTPNVAKWTRRIKLALGYFPSTASLREGWLSYDRRSPTDLYDEGHLHYFTYRSLEHLLVRRAGFTSVRAFGYGRSPLARVAPRLFSDVALVAAR
jgi:SAM-dependent methyltransferase